MFKAPAIYFSSTVVFIDDDPLYAKLLIDRLGIQRLKHVESPDFLLRQKHDDFLFVDSDIFKKEKDGEFAYIKHNIDALKKSGTLVSVLVSDLHMDTCLGTEIFAALSSPHVGRILVSNFIDYHKGSDVAEAINNRHVDIILDKTKNFVEELPKAILAAKNKFFTSLSNALFPHACDGHALADTEFARFFLGKIEELKPESIQSNSTFNRFTFSFSDERPDLVMHVTEKREIQSFLESSAADAAPKELLSHLSSGAYMLCYEDEVLPDGRQWPLFVRPAKQLEGKNHKFFYNISESHNVASVDVR